jgi:acetate kinase
MQSILVVNAGSSSVKFQIFESSPLDAPRRLIKGQVEGIGARPRLRAEASDGSLLIDQSYAATEVADVPAATAVAAEWLRQTPGIELIAVGRPSDIANLPRAFGHSADTRILQLAV